MLLLAPLVLGGCTDLKRALGMEKVVPDEFAVVKAAPLALPPDFSLRPPRPGAAPTQEVSPTEQARQTIFRASDQQAATLPDADKLSTGENQLLRQAGAAAAPRDIRDTVNREAMQSAAPVDESFASKLLFWRTPEKKLGPTDRVIDPAQEAQRLKGSAAAQAAGTPAAGAGAAATPAAGTPPAAATPAAAAPAAPAAQPELLGPPTIERKGEPKIVG
jgi:Xaa-Pro aminopeptidase